LIVYFTHLNTIFVPRCGSNVVQQMTTFKAVVYKHHRKEDGTFNIKIRITHHRMKRHIATTYFVTKDDLTKGFKIKNQSIIDELDRTIKKYRKACDALGERVKDMDADQVLHYLETYNEKKGSFRLDFIAYGRDKIVEMQAKNRAGNAKTYNVMLNSLETYLGRDTLDISEINVNFLKLYVNWIESKPAPSKREKGERAVSLYLSNIRALHNMAKDEYNDEDNGIINIPLSPFAKFKVPKSPVTRKRAVPIETIQAIAKLPYQVVSHQGMNLFNFARDMFLLSFGLVGMNTVDLYSCESIKDGRITYNRTKTKNRREDKAEISIRIEPEIKALVEKYRDKTGKRVFSFYQNYISPDTFGTAVNKGLKLIGKHETVKAEDLEFYASRHSWATIATNQAKVNKYTVHSALNHVTEEMKVTDIYIDKSYALIDEANRKVLDLVKLKIGSVRETKKEKKKPVVKQI